MDELDRLFALLVGALARDARVAVPFPAADLYERLVPYRSNRSRLNVATHQDYEMTVLRLLAGERNYVQLEPDNVREAMQREIATINPDPAYFRSFPDAQVMVNGRAAERVLQADHAYAPPRSGAEEDDELVDTTGENPVPVPFVPPMQFRPTPSSFGSRPKEPLAPNQCEYCGGVLPANRKAAFCPHCGQPQEGELKCPGCGSELDVGWAYCLSCGRATGFE
ncbi:MAG TPA: zinc ribbon domain-containing protein [Gemmatimonadales bacterium]|nr:zinc ribbon domain-containing protein [Gemmatimonadales bacterium]